jgi:hypothetical protein
MLICYAYSLKGLRGRQLVEVFVAFLEATAAIFPSLREIFNYSNDTTTSSASEILHLTTSFRKLLAGINQTQIIRPNSSKALIF